MERLCQDLRRTLILKLELTALGSSAILAWTYVASLVVSSCPAQEGGIVIRLLTPPLGEAGVIVWALLLVVGSWSLREWFFSFVAAVVAAVFSTLLLGEPVLLAALSVILLWASARESVEACVEAIALGVIAIEGLVLTYLLVRAYTVRLPVPAVFPLHLSLYCIFTPFIPLAVFATLLSPLATLLPRRQVKVETSLRGRLALALGLAMCALLWLVLYMSEINKSSKLIGVDSITRYYPHALQMLAGGLPSVLRVGYDRPLYYLLLYRLANSLGPYEAVKLLPLVALTLYVVASYLAAKELSGDREASLAALVAPLTYTVTAGLYGGLYANWTSLSVALIAVASLVRWLKRGRSLWLVTYLLMLVGAVATHIYMGAVFFASTTAFALICSLFRKYRSRSLIMLTAQLALAALGIRAADSLAPDLNFHSPSQVIQVLSRAWWNRVQRLQLFSPTWWEDYGFAIYEYAATAALDPTVWVLTFIGIASTPHKLSSMMLVPWLTIVHVLSFTAPSDLMWRALFDFPFSISEAFGLAFLLSVIRKRFGKVVELLWLIAIVFFKLNYTLAFAVGLAS